MMFEYKFLCGQSDKFKEQRDFQVAAAHRHEFYIYASNLLSVTLLCKSASTDQ